MILYAVALLDEFVLIVDKYLAKDDAGQCKSLLASHLRDVDDTQLPIFQCPHEQIHHLTGWIMKHVHDGVHVGSCSNRLCLLILFVDPKQLGYVLKWCVMSRTVYQIHEGFPLFYPTLTQLDDVLLLLAFSIECD